MTQVFDEVSVVGIDGCKKGWCCSFFDQGLVRIIVIERIDELHRVFPNLKNILIDIPVGLSSKGQTRDLDQFARHHLKPGNTSSLFTAPAREALHSNDYYQACQKNFEITGKKISIQCWNISQKTLEVDNYLLRNSPMKGILHEAHPEICFKYLNNNTLLSYRKHEKKAKGIKERLKILSKFYKDIYSPFEQALALYNRKELKSDDVVDAICLNIVGELGVRYGFDQISGGAPIDEHGIDLKLYYFNPARHKSIQLIHLP